MTPTTRVVAFEIDGRVYFTDPPMLEMLNQHRERGNLRVMQWWFAMNLAMGRIKPQLLHH